MALPRHLPFQQEVFKLFPSSFPQTAHELEAETETVARQLAESANKAPKWATSSGPGLAQFYKGATLAVVEYALQKPHAIDFLVTVYERATKLFPTEMNPSWDTAGWIARREFHIVLYEVRGQDFKEGFVGNLANTGPADRYTITLNTTMGLRISIHLREWGGIWQPS